MARMFLLGIVLAGSLGAAFAVRAEAKPAQPAQSIAEGAPIQYRVGFLGIPCTPTTFKMHREVPWTRENLQRLKDLGFNTIQLNVAWGTRPGDEPLNLEDVIRLEEPLAKEYPPTDTGRIRRRALCMAYHLRETNLARLMRSNAVARPEAVERARKELLAVLQADRENFREEMAQTPLSPLGTAQSGSWPEIDAAIELLQKDPVEFLATFLK